MLSVLRLSSNGERPYELLDELRDSVSVQQIDEPPGGTLLLRHQEVSRALVDKSLTLDGKVMEFQPATRKTGRAHQFDWYGRGALVEGSHSASALRQIALQSLSRKGLQNTKASINHVIRSITSSIGKGMNLDLYADYGLPIAAGCLFQMFDADCPITSELVGYAHDFVGLASPYRNLADSLKIHRSIRWFRQNMHQILTQSGQQGELLRNLMAAYSTRDDINSGLGEDDVIRFCIELLAAGVHTVATAITQSLAFYYLDHEARREFPKSLDGVADWVSEAIRIESFVLFLVRFVRTEVEFGNVVLHPGELLWLSPAAANRDPRVFDRPTKFLSNRDLSKSLAFGRGSHHCLGRDLALLEASSAVWSFVHAFPNANLFGPITWGGDILARTPLEARVEV